MPSQVVYDLLNDVIDPSGVRQDHLFMSRVTDANGRFTLPALVVGQEYEISLMKETTLWQLQ